MEKSELLAATARFVKAFFDGEGSGHDWWHIYRVRKMALMIGESVGADLFLVELGALLHDVDDWKLKDAAKENKTVEWLRSCGVEPSVIDRVIAIIEGVSFKGAGVDTSTNNLECQVIQDADRLDAVGAIGIARTFAYGGSRGRAIYDPEIEPVMHSDFEQYKKSDAPTLNHFYEKLLLLKAQMQTPMGKILAIQRHDYMVHYIDQFFLEWNEGL